MSQSGDGNGSLGLGNAKMREMDPKVGLCSVCVNVRPVENMNGSVFYLCELALVDRRYRKYPVLPVVECSGFAPKAPVVMDSQ